MFWLDFVVHKKLTHRQTVFEVCCQLVEGCGWLSGHKPEDFGYPNKHLPSPAGRANDFASPVSYTSNGHHANTHFLVMFSGDHCDSCVDGFFGDPSGSRGPRTRCKKCDCNGNIDNNAVQNCDSETGDCLKCIYNTRNGPNNQCELCKVGFYGDATSYPKPGCKRK